MIYPTSIPAQNPIVAAIAALYGVATEFNAYLDGLIDSMRKSPNETISRTGRVIEGAKFGFGVGFMAPVIIIAVGQLLLGNPLAAAGAVLTVPFSPISMTCAAVGAIYYGWSALSDDERNAILERLSQGMQVGVEIIKAVIAFVVSKPKELLSSENLAEFKRFIGEAASAFGRTLVDVTRSIKDRAVGAYEFVADKLAKNAPEDPPLPRLPL